MAKHSCDRNNQPRPAAVSVPPAYPEPEVRRWPHPVCGTVPSAEPEPCLHYIHCTLVYQNQLLSEIKTLMEQLCTDSVRTPFSLAPNPPEK